MIVDSFAFVPRSFRRLYEEVRPFKGEGDPVWASFGRRLTDATIAVVTSAGLYVQGRQDAFDIERERREPRWGDPSWRAIPDGVRTNELGMTHLHVNNDDVLADHNIALPTDVLGDLVDEGFVGAITPEHVSVMGFQEEGLDVWRERTAPEVAARLHDHGTDGVVLAPI